jgi:hypothetical protein
MNAATRVGLRFGILLGALAVVNHTLEVFGRLGPALSAVRGVGMWAVTFVLFGFASRQVSDRVATIPVGMVASSLSAVSSTGILVLFAIIAAEVQSQPLPAATIASTGSSHLAGSVAIGLFVAGIGGCVASALTPTTKARLAFGAGVMLLLLCAALASIVHASFLPRSQRPPFIWFGLPAMAVALAAVAPLVSATRMKRAVPGLKIE